MAQYIAICACQYGCRIYKANEVLKFNAEVVVCPDCKGKKGETVCDLCKDSGRTKPNHHFKEIGVEHAKEEEKREKVLRDEPKKENDQEGSKEEIKQIRDEITRLGGSYSSRWHPDRLKQELLVTQKKYGEKNAMYPKPEVNKGDIVSVPIP